MIVKIDLTGLLSEGDTEKMVIFTLMDALAEFQSARNPVDTYVYNRYPTDNPGYAWMDREEKIRQVQRRKWLAETMRNRVEVITE